MDFQTHGYRFGVLLHEHQPPAEGSFAAIFKSLKFPIFPMLFQEDFYNRGFLSDPYL
jgi:hypothetical protein